MTDAPKPPVTQPTVDELKSDINALAMRLRMVYGGERCAVIIAVGFPIDGGHDRFAATCTGPCLTGRGLLAWATRSVNDQIDRSDTSFTGKEHP